MLRKSAFRIGCRAAAVGSLAVGATAQAVTIDGTRSAGDGYSLVSTQVNVTSSPTDGGGPGGPANLAGPTSTNLTQLSNVYSRIDPVTNTLNLFIGGSINKDDQGVSHYVIALQTQTSGVSSLAGQHIAGSVYEGNGNNPANENTGNDGLLNVNFDTGFTPNALLVIQPDTSGGTTTNTGPYTGFTDLTSSGESSAFSVGYNGSLLNTAIGTGTAGDPGFAGAATGLEISIPLANLGYVAGTSIKALAFTTNGGSDGRTNNQILAPFTYPGNVDAGGPSSYDYTYIDAARQFTSAAYPGDQFFTIPGASVPEPATLGLVALGGVLALRRRARSV